MSTANPQDFSCPKCCQVDSVQKVSSVVGAGTATGTFAGSTSAVGYSYSNQGGYTTLAGTSQTSLAQRLSRPNQPVYGNPWGCGIISVIGTLFFLGGAFSIQLLYILSDTSPGVTRPTPEQVPEILIAAILSAIIFWGGAIWIISYTERTASTRRTEHNAAMRRWEQACRQWDKLYYCFRNDVVFIPDELGACVSVSEMFRLL